MSTELTPEEHEVARSLEVSLDASTESRQVVATALAKLRGLIEHNRQSDFPTAPTK